MLDQERLYALSVKNINRITDELLTVDNQYASAANRKLKRMIESHRAYFGDRCSKHGV